MNSKKSLIVTADGSRLRSWYAAAKDGRATVVVFHGNAGCIAGRVRIDAPLLIFHGDRDRVVPLRFGQRLFERAGEPKQMHIVRGAAHNNLGRFGTMARELAFVGRVTLN